MTGKGKASSRKALQAGAAAGVVAVAAAMLASEENSVPAGSGGSGEDGKEPKISGRPVLRIAVPKPSFARAGKASAPEPLPPAEDITQSRKPRVPAASATRLNSSGQSEIPLPSEHGSAETYNSPPLGAAHLADPVRQANATGTQPESPLSAAPVSAAEPDSGPTPTPEPTPAAKPAPVSEREPAINGGPWLPDPEFGALPAAPSPTAPTEPALAPPGADPVAPTTAAEPPEPTPSSTVKAPAPDTTLAEAGGAPPVLADDDELILELRLRNGQLADTVVAYGTRAGVYLPLGALARTLDLAILVAEDGKRAEGWFLAEERKLDIDLTHERLTAEGRSEKIEAGRIVAFRGEMYVRDDYLSHFLPLSMVTDLRDQSITVTTLEPFPFEERLAREEKRARLGAAAENAAPEQLPRIEIPWRMVDVPLADLELRAASDSALGHRGEIETRLSGDLALMTGQFFATGSTRDGLTSTRFELGRRDPDGDLLGPLKATQFALGDVSLLALPLGARGMSGRGLSFSNAALQQASIFEKVDLRGELPDGYEVELYRNNVLVGSTRQAVNGQFEFLQVPAEFGLNVMRLAFYGPQGQRRDEVRQINVGDGRVPAGQLIYSVGLAQKDRNLFDVYGPNFFRTADFGSLRASIQATYGISTGLTASLHGAQFGANGSNRLQAGGGLRSALGPFSLRLDGAFQHDASSGGAGLNRQATGSAVELGVAGRMLGAAFTLGRTEYQGGFIDELRTYAGESLRNATELGLTGSLKLGSDASPFTIPYSGRFRQIEFRDGREQINASFRASTRAGGALLAGAFEYQGTRGPGMAPADRMLGTFDLAVMANRRTQVRVGLGMDIMPRLRPVAATVELDHSLDPRTLIKGTVGRAFDSHQTSLGFSATRKFHRFTLGFDSSLTLPDRIYGVALRLGFSLGRNPLTRRAFMDHPGLAGSGALALRAFHDRDGDGVFGAADIVLPEVAFGGGTGTVKTDRDGYALIPDLPAGDRASILFDVDTLDDITLAPRSPGIAVVARQGRIPAVDFPIIEVREVAGTVLFERAEGPQPLSGMRLELIDAADKTIAFARSGSDGTFLFEEVPPGAYRVRLEPEQASRFGMHIAQDVQLQARPGQPIAPVTLHVARTLTPLQHHAAH